MQRFKFTDTLENIRQTRYYKWLQGNVAISIGEKHMKKNYLIENGYRSIEDENKQRDYISEEEFSILLKIEQTYHDDFLRLGCERLWAGNLNEKQKGFSKQIRDKRKQLSIFYN